jgi:hypothetical protein
VDGEPVDAARGRVSDAVPDFGPARRPEMSGMFRARRCNVSLGWIVTIALFSASHVMAAGAATETQALERFLAQTSRVHSDSPAVELDIEANLPKLHKSAKLRTLQFVSGMGHSVFRTLDSEGDAMVRREVIARYLRVEAEGQEAPNRAVAITPANYSFVFRGVTDYAGQAAYVYRLTPKRKRAGLFKGELWLDEETGSVLREWGEFVKSPSWFVKSVYFVRDYMMKSGKSRTSEPRRLILNVSTRLFGKADVTIWFDKAPDALRDSALNSPDAALSKNGRPQLGAGQ